MFFATALPSILLFSTRPWLAAANGRDQQPPAPSPENTIYNDQNIRYVATVVVGGQSINVTLDTGSTDMWLNPRGGVGTFEDTRVPHKIAYADGNSYINGTIGLMQVSLAGHVVPKQAFVNVTENVNEDQCGHGVCGLIGLGFDNPDGGIEKALSDAGQDGPKIGKSLLSNIFDMNPDKGRFFALSLSRLDDSQDSAPATLHIADYDPRYASVQYEPMRPVFPSNKTTWDILSNGFTVNGYHLPLTANPENGAPPGQIIVGLDSGSPGVHTRPEIRDAIYSQIPGAVLAKNSSIPVRTWRKDEDVWVVPCNASVELTLDFGSNSYPVHPLDLTTMYTVTKDGVERTICTNTITNGGSIGGNPKGKDLLFGDPFLRNVYTVYSFGNSTTPPFAQFLPLTNASEAAKDFTSIRNKLLADGPPRA
ncbi:Six-hairpin glycosidase [Mycena venus]|uniref:Six-hairpin glycosidase n=1 Tax=Mycena venus TaxID=2733690 RepID=A0A8H7D346_9AGAR|nr:Six-hairpin glycosidase [Mycena venus]